MEKHLSDDQNSREFWFIFSIEPVQHLKAHEAEVKEITYSKEKKTNFFGPLALVSKTNTNDG